MPRCLRCDADVKPPTSKFLNTALVTTAGKVGSYGQEAKPTGKGDISPPAGRALFDHSKSNLAWLINSANSLKSSLLGTSAQMSRNFNVGLQPLFSLWRFIIFSRYTALQVGTPMAPKHTTNQPAKRPYVVRNF